MRPRRLVHPVSMVPPTLDLLPGLIRQHVKTIVCPEPVSCCHPSSGNVALALGEFQLT